MFTHPLAVSCCNENFRTHSLFAMMSFFSKTQRSSLSISDERGFPPGAARTILISLLRLPTPALFAAKRVSDNLSIATELLAASAAGVTFVAS